MATFAIRHSNQETNGASNSGPKHFDHGRVIKMCDRIKRELKARTRIDEKALHTGEFAKAEIFQDHK